MAASSATKNTKGPIIDPGLCRCCRSIKKCRLLTAEYEWSGQKEIYSDMFMDSFGLLLSNLDGDTKHSCICATCVVRLRDACAFRHQVLQCEQAILDLVQAKEVSEDKKLWQVDVKMEPCDETGDLDETRPSSPAPCLSDGTDSDYERLIKLVPQKKKAVKLKLKSDKKVTKRKLRNKSTKASKKELIGTKSKMKAKIDAMADDGANQKYVPQETEEIKNAKKKKDSLLHDDMIFRNTVTLVQNSFICPFITRISMYYCYYCKDQFTNPSELREHTLTHNPVEKFENMIEYNKMPKMDITRIDCRLCDEKIDTIEEFKNHITVTHGKVLYPAENEFIKYKLTMNNLKCTECDATFPYIDSLVKHMIDHFGTFVCDLCGACFIILASLRSHIKNHSRVELNFPCEICGKNLKSKYSRILHISTIHEKKATINCYKCEATFLSYALRTKHLIEVHGDKRMFPCKICDKVYNRRKTLVEHNRRNHLKVFRHKCDLCDQKFYLPSRLKEHMATHTGERNYRCEYCDKSYPRLQSLQEHARTHSERRYKCTMCPAHLSHSTSLQLHMRSHHQYEMDASGETAI